MYSIGAVQKETGLTGRQIRYYESMGLIQVARTEGNQRRYTDRDIVRLLEIKGLIERNLDVNTVKKLLSQEDAEVQDSSNEHKSTASQSSSTNSVIGDKLTSLYPVSNRAELLALLTSMEVKPIKGDQQKEASRPIFQ